MPTYEYRCPKGHEFELFQRISDEPGAACPECGEAAERQISAGAGFLFKGDGFYITDYRSADYKKKASSEGSSSSSAGASSSKSDSGGSTSSSKGDASGGGS
jgi:putative FmdB family regulatory protein